MARKSYSRSLVSQTRTARLRGIVPQNLGTRPVSNLHGKFSQVKRSGEIHSIWKIENNYPNPLNDFPFHSKLRVLAA